MTETRFSSTTCTLKTESMSRSYRTETPSEPNKRDDLSSVRTGGTAETCGAGNDTKKCKTTRTYI